MSEFDDIAELMAEPPGGHNHGRERGAEGAWEPLESADWDSLHAFPVPIHGEGLSIKRPVDRRKHGTVYTYVKIKCRCEPCKRGWADYQRQHRAK